MTTHLYIHALAALLSAATTMANCQGSARDVPGLSRVFDATREAPVTWRGEAQWLDVRAAGARVHLRTVPSGAIEIRATARHRRDARDSADEAPFELRASRHGHGVTVCMVPAGSGDERCPEDAGDGSELRLPAVDLDVQVPEGVRLHLA